jgi:uncharacterized protein (TIGR02594 family)
MILRQGMSGSEVKQVQVRLKELGFFQGTPQGNFGPLTDAAVRAFQAANGLKVDGLVGPNTWSVLFPGKAPGGEAPRTKDLPPWFLLAMQDLYRGVKEIPGALHNPYIVEAHGHTSLKARDDETPWCSSIVCLWFEKNGIRSTRSAAAASWRTWGQELEYGVPGCVVIMTRTGGNHVGLYLGEDSQGVYVLGGNQDNMVCVRRYAWSLITNFRWPTEAEGWREAA